MAFARVSKPSRFEWMRQERLSNFRGNLSLIEARNRGPSLREIARMTPYEFQQFSEKHPNWAA